MSDETSQKLVGDVFRFNAAMNELDLAEAERRYDDLLARRSKLQERFAAGGIILNATSLTAVFSSLQTGQLGLQKLGISINSASAASGIFVIGIIFAVAAHWLETIEAPTWAAEQYQRLGILRRQRAAMRSHVDKKMVDLTGKQITELESHPPQDFRYSPLQMWMNHFSGSLWLVGVCMLVWPVWKQQLQQPWFAF